MATKKEQRARTQRRKENIQELRNKINQVDSNEIHPFTKYKIITYLWIFLFAPYALYRVWKKDTEFNRTEKAAQTFFICCCVCSFVSLVL